MKYTCIILPFIFSFFTTYCQTVENIKNNWVAKYSTIVSDSYEVDSIELHGYSKKKPDGNYFYIDFTYWKRNIFQRVTIDDITRATCGVSNVHLERWKMCNKNNMRVLVRTDVKTKKSATYNLYPTYDGLGNIITLLLVRRTSR